MPQTREGKAFLEYYRTCQDTPDKLARRARLDPIEIPQLLPHMFIVDAKHEEFRFRLVGTSIAKAMGQDNTNKRIDEVLEGQDLETIRSILQRCIRNHTCIITREHIQETGHDFYEIEIVRTPWLDEDGEPRFVIGTFSVFGFNSAKGSAKVHFEKTVTLEDRVPEDEELSLTVSSG